MSEARSLFEKIWHSHVVKQESDCPAVLYVDLHLVHEVTSPQAFQLLRERGLRVRRPDLTQVTIDHSIPTTALSEPITDEMCARQVAQMEANAAEFGLPIYGRGHPRGGVVHVIGPELGLSQPGMTIVCGDSHTATHGAMGALAFGVGTSEVEQVLATQCLLQNKPASMEVRVTGPAELPRGVTAKDLVLAVIAGMGTGGGTGHVIEYTGAAVRALAMEGRMTLCNMTIEAGARAGMVSPDDATFEYLAGRPFAPQGKAWDAAVGSWRDLSSDEGAGYDRVFTLDGGKLEPMITFGTNPGMAVAVTGRVPDPSRAADGAARRALEKALTYMGLQPGQPMIGQPVQVVFVGSCTNGRISDLRAAAGVLKGRRVAAGVRMMVVPGSRQVKELAEAEGLDKVFAQAGAEWREPGCSMCIGMNGDNLGPGQYGVSTTNRNFEGRQGVGGRTLLASPLTAAASAVAGAVADPRSLMG
jgi:3-isopropylmalate/(R)-2-methylmalate dehydratase large subunit